MPASIRTHASRATSSRPYDRLSPTASPPQSENPLVHPRLSRNAPPASPTQTADAGTDTDLDQDTPPDVPGLPTYAEYKRIEVGYIHSLSPRKRDKALITQAMFDKIWDVLHQPEACTIDTPQFRFWVRKMFSLSRPVRADGSLGWGGGDRQVGVTTMTHPIPLLDSEAEADLELERSMGIAPNQSSAEAFTLTAVVLHENRPVAIMEQLYTLFCYCHVRAGHGGRDKTCAVIREHYSWVPKELTAQFVKACPTCALKRSGMGYGAGGVVDAGVVAHTSRRAAGRGARKGRVVPLQAAEETPVQVRPLVLSSAGWPTTGGPLDPENPEPCGVRERERQWLRAREDLGTVGPLSLTGVSPARDSRMRSVLREANLGTKNCLLARWNSVPRALTVGTSLFHQCDATRPMDQPFAVDSNSEKSGPTSPTKTELPSLASALSNESLDENVNLTGLGPGESDSGEGLLPPTLRPLRLLGPVPSDSDSDLLVPSYPVQIDPLLLSFNYPGLGPSSEPGFPSDLGSDAVPLAQGTSSGDESAVYGDQGMRSTMNWTRTIPPSVRRMDVPALDPSRESDSPDSSFERAGSYTIPDGTSTLPFSLSTELMTRSRCGIRPGYRDGPLTMLYHCSADQVGKELDEPLSFSIMTDA